MPASSGAPAGRTLEIRKLTAGYGDVPVVSDVSISVAPGDIVALLGPNGAGKSTLLKAVVGESRIMSGSVHFGDQDVTRMPAERLARLGIGYVPQSGNVFRALTVTENLEMGAYSLPRRQVTARVESVMQRFPELQILARTVVNKLSGGEQRLVALGRALVLEPKVLLLDEPTANLSPKNAHRVLREYVASIAEAGAGVLLVEQRAREALETASRACILVAGHVEITGSADELQRRDDVGRLFLGDVASS